MSKSIRYIVLLGLTVAGLGLVLFVVVYNKIVLAPMSTGPGKDIIFEVKIGEAPKVLCHELVGAGIIKSEKIFCLYAKLSGIRSKFKAGEYKFNTDMDMAQVAAVIASGKSITHPFTISDGLNLYEVALKFEEAGFGPKQEFIDACFDKDLLTKLLGEAPYSCEGYLFPETYSLERRTTPAHLIEKMVGLFLKNYNVVKAETFATSAPTPVVSTWSRQQIITLASIVEKETGAMEERPVIASVFFNRLKKNMRLQTDPTVLYGVLDRDKHYKANISKDDLVTPTKYNTYTNAGLPFGPIANPGLDAMRAVFSPALTDYLYFVSKNEGRHTFSKTYEEHLAAVGKFQVNRKARVGKSWRQLKQDKATKLVKPGPAKQAIK